MRTVLVVQINMLRGQVQAPASLPTSRRVWRLSKLGSIRNLVLEESPLAQGSAPSYAAAAAPVPALAVAATAPSSATPAAPAIVDVRVRAIGLNFADVFCCLGLYAAAPKGAPFIPGLEFSGEVLAVHPATSAAPCAGASRVSSTAEASAGATSVPHFQPGDRVLGVTRFGAFSDHISLDARYLRTFPETWSYSEAAAFPVQTLTAAYGLLDLGALGPGQTALVQSAAGGVGLQALAICKARGAEALGLVGSSSKLGVLQQLHPGSRILGADGKLQPCSSSGSATKSGSDGMVFAVRPPEPSAFQSQLKQYLRATGRAGFDCILDSVTGRYFQPAYDALAPCGRHVVFGAADLTPSTTANLERGVTLLSPSNLAAAARLLWGWLTRPRLNVLTMPGENKGVLGFNLIWLYGQLPLMARLYDSIEGLDLPPPHVGAEFDFDHLPAALELLQSGSSIGKVVVKLEG